MNDIKEKVELMIEAAYMVGWVTRDVEGEKSNSNKPYFPKHNAAKIHNLYMKQMEKEINKLKTYNRSQDDFSRIYVSDEASAYNQALQDVLDLLSHKK